MRTTVHFKLLLSAMLLTAACDRTSQLPAPDNPAQVYPIAQLKMLCTKASVYVTQQVIISGTIVGNDQYGEFEKTLILEDATGGISIAADHPHLSAEFPFGAQVIVSCNGLTLCDYGGKVELGTPPTEYGAGRIPRYELARFVRRTSQQAVTPIASKYTFTDISSAQIDTYVRFDDVRFTAPGRWCTTDPETGRPTTTEHTIADTQGRLFTVRVSATCDYATEPLPEGKGSVEGVIDYFNGGYSLCVTNRMIRFTASEGYPTTSLSDARY